MPVARTDITAIVLAGGRGRRMAGEDKGLIRLAGRPLVEHVIERLRPQVGSIAISANRNLTRYRRLGLAVYSDAEPGSQGPLAGLLAGLEHSSTPWVLTAPCDAPLLPPDLAARLAASVESSGALAGSVRAGGRVHAAFMLVSRELAGDLRESLQRGERRVQGWLERHHRALADFGDCDDAFTNINTPEQLRGVERTLGDQCP